MRLRRFALLAALFCGWAGRSAGAELSGYAAARYFYLDGVTGGDNYLLDERLRPTFTETLDSLPEVTLTVTPQVLLKQGRNSPAIAEVDDYLTVERLYLEAALSRVSLRLGRQELHWGSGKFWNPTDVFRETFLADYWAERKGVNAARADLHLPQAVELSAIVATGDTVFDKNRYAGRATISRWNQALSAVFMDDQVKEQYVYGADFHGRYKIGYWVEAAWYDAKPKGVPDHAEAATGLDYLIKVRSGAAVAVQYFHDGSGVTHPSQYDRLLTLFGLRTNLAQNYATFSGLLNWNKTATLGLNLICNLDDGTSFWIPSTNLNLSKGFQVNLGANLFAGARGGEFHLADAKYLVEQTPPGTFPFLFDSPAAVMNGVASAMYYMWLRWNF